MKLTEIMIIKKNDTGNRLKLCQVDDSTIAKLTRIRGNLYRDDPRLTVAKDPPNLTVEDAITPERQAWIDGAYAKCLANQVAKATPAAIQPMSFEEQLEHDWRHSPSLRKEFTSFGSYQAYMRAAESGRTKVYGRG